MKLLVKTSGGGVAKEIEMTAEFIANELNEEIYGGNAKESQIAIVTQEFVNKHKITACYTSGTYLYLRCNEEAYDELEDAIS